VSGVNPVTESSQSGVMLAPLPAGIRASRYREPRLWYVTAVLLVSLIPSTAHWFGVDFDATNRLPNLSDLEENRDNPALLMDELHRDLRGSFVHTILQWTALTIAVVTAVFALVHRTVRRSIVTPVIGVSLFWAACFDAYHTLAADRLLHESAPDENLIPFTWAICRLFNALILLAAAGAILLLPRRSAARSGPPFVVALSLGFGVLAYVLIRTCATSTGLPETLFPEQTVTRPWDVVPLVLYLVGSLTLFPLLYRRARDVFSFSLWLSCVPHMLAQVQMVLGSSQLFDHHFNMALVLKVIAYAVPLSGLLIDYAQTYRHEREIRGALAEQTRALDRRNDEMQQLLYVVSHDLRSPLVTIEGFAGLLSRYVEQGQTDKSHDAIGRIHRASKTMNALIGDLLELSRLDRAGLVLEEVDVGEVLHEVAESVHVPLLRAQATLDVRQPLPRVEADRRRLFDVFLNLVGNGVKYGCPAPGARVTVAGEVVEDEIRYCVADDGPGIPPEFHKDVFQLFKRLDPRQEGTGLGLAIVQKVMQLHGGRAWVESQPDHGARFWVAFPDRRRSTRGEP
jgi:signal transduction histidine kinase